ncbi:MAG: (2Fe-2S)-binding protein [Paracoccaceae bacterium]|jgi:carbon-monoxide dehydrogenase small subunit
MRVSLTLNREPTVIDVEPRQSLADAVRAAGFTGTHVGCEHGVCGACTIRVDGVAVRGCLMLAVQAEGAIVETVEGLDEADLKAAFVRHNALQCGFCTPGMLISAAELLQGGHVPHRAEIREHLSGNYCRCTGYQAIIDAVEEVANSRHGARP